MKSTPRTSENRICHTADQSGVALVIVLAFVVLLTGLMVAFFSRAISDRQIANSSAIQTRTEIFGLGAINSIVGDLKEEIAAGSTIVTSNSTTVYLPSSANERRASLPYAFDDTPLNSVLLKRSANGKDFFPKPPVQAGSYPNIGTYPPSQRAIALSTTTPSINGRAVSAVRWNKPLLFDPTQYSGGVPAAMVPDWILVGRDGTNPQAASTNVVGRYAYMMYDEGALLDINVAGGPASSPFTKPQIGAKGSLALADLTQLSPALTQKQIDTLVGWRNNATAQTTGTVRDGYSVTGSANFYNFLTQTGFTLTNPTGFLTVGTLPATVTTTNQTDKMFNSRQELIRFITQGMAPVPTDSATLLKLQSLLQNLGTFSREKNAPSWMPKSVPGAVAGSVGDYAGNAINPSSTTINLNVATVTVSNPFVRKLTDGTTAQKGEPLMKYRFPLYRLGLFNNPVANADAIQKYFCIRQRNTPPVLPTDALNGMWEYFDPDTSPLGVTPVATVGLPHIKTLDQVAQAGREPTFWEVLQAAILSGSVGTTFSYGYAAWNGADPGNNAIKTDPSADSSATRQIFKIGLDLIDQYDTDDDPTSLSLGRTTPTSDTTDTAFITGEENLPGIHFIAESNFQDNKTNIGAANAFIEGYHMFIIWNPHRNPSEANTNPSNPSGIVQCSIHADGIVYTQVGANLSGAGQVDQYSPPLTFSGTPLTFNTTANRCFDKMDYIKPSDLVASASSDFVSFPPPSSSAVTASPMTISPITVGFFHGKTAWPKGTVPDRIFHLYNQPMTYTLGKYDARGRWLPYLVIPYIGGTLGDNGSAFLEVTPYVNAGAVNTAVSMWHSDPRTDRFGWLGDGEPDARNILQQGYPAWNYVDRNGNSIFNNNYYQDHLAFGQSGVGVYQDPDGTYRRADGVYNDPNGVTEGNPFDLATEATASSRPTILNRAFTSVAEMGFAYRDTPWKSLNFFSADSADGGLLDFFTVNEESSTRAGVLNLNNASVATLTAVLQGAYQEALPPDGVYLDATAVTAANQTIAQAIRSYLGPIKNPTHVISSVADLPILTGNVAKNLPSPLKARCEVLPRALADVTNTRTWNLLIDVVAQSGRYGPGVSDLKQFNVEGEQRVWVHLAIDRYTGEIVDRQLEYVTE